MTCVAPNPIAVRMDQVTVCDRGSEVITAASRINAFGALERCHTALVFSRPRCRDPYDSAASRAESRAGASIPLHRSVDGDRRSVAGLLGAARG